MHPAGAGDYSASYYPPYPASAPAPAPPPPTFHPYDNSASAPPYSPYPTHDYPPAPAPVPYPTYPPPPAAAADHLPHHYAPPPPTTAPPQPYYPYEPSPLPSQHHIPAPSPSPYPSLDRPTTYGGYGSGDGYAPQQGQLYPAPPPPPPSAGGWSDDGAYAYRGGDAPEPYGARGTAPRSGSGSAAAALFDDYGRSIGPGGKERGAGGGAASPKVVRAVPKAETSEDVRGGVQKFRVKLLPEGAGSPMDVLCQVGLDGIRMLDPNTSRTLRIYSLENVTRWDVLDSSIFAFWSKSSVDHEARRIRLKSSSYTTNTILDTVTAASVQFKEMGGSSISRSKAVSDAASPSEPQTEKRKNFLDWRNLMKPMIEEKDHWVPDEAVNKCTGCAGDFSAFNRRHHCRNCGDVFCDKCTQGRTPLNSDADSQPVRVCDKCMAEVSRRLNSAKEAANRPIVHSHEDLAKKLQEAMDINKKTSSGSRSSDGSSGKRMREVACPICTVHLQVPASGSETIECGVCQHPFLVSSR
ncbi:protein FREE1 isoform X2 [Lolium perenne]|uniref:protein FREE1 isoform X2 n=1 Tax=Lolium perenne TaxID=4522 RepID=UPI0021F64313|nr:protein FREE1-like isoform X2 [Lolium perenne]